MGKQMDFTHCQVRCPKGLWKEFQAQIKKSRISQNAALVALIEDAVGGQIEFKKVEKPLYVVRRSATTRDVMAGKVETERKPEN